MIKHQKISVDETWQYGLFSQQQPKFKQLLAEISQLLASKPHAVQLSDLDIASRQHLLELWFGFLQLQASNKIAPLVIKMALKQPKITVPCFTDAASGLSGLVCE